jgi:hypothetical protein
VRAPPADREKVSSSPGNAPRLRQNSLPDPIAAEHGLLDWLAKRSGRSGRSVEDSPGAGDDMEVEPVACVGEVDAADLMNPL